MNDIDKENSNQDVPEIKDPVDEGFDPQDALGHQEEPNVAESKDSGDCVDKPELEENIKQDDEVQETPVEPVHEPQPPHYVGQCRTTPPVTPTPPKGNGGVIGVIAIILSICIGLLCFASVSALNKNMQETINKAVTQAVKEEVGKIIIDATSSAQPNNGDTNPGDNTSAPIIINGAGNQGLAGSVYNNNLDSVVEIKADTVQVSIFGYLPATSSGSGFIVESDGYVLTNYHVVADSSSVTVILHSGDEYTAEIVGYNVDHDIAVLKIDATDLNPVTVSNSDDVRVGDAIYAIGHPMGLSYSMTGGIISYVDRLVSDANGNPMYVFQTDCSLNEGNSGGPVFDASGAVIGIANAKYAGNGVEGLGFAVPINDAMSDYAQIKEHGEVINKASLGVEVANATTPHYGAYVHTVTPGSAAEKAGLKPGDIIVQADGKSVKSSNDLIAILRKHVAEDTIEMLIYRDGEVYTTEVTFDAKVNTPEPTPGPTPTVDPNEVFDGEYKPLPKDDGKGDDIVEATKAPIETPTVDNTDENTGDLNVPGWPWGFDFGF